MDLLDKAMWADKCRQNKVKTTDVAGSYFNVRQQLLRIEGLMVQEKKDGPEVPFDVEKHFDKLGLTPLMAIDREIQKKADLSEIDIKNFARPYASFDQNGMANSPAAVVPKDNGMPSDVVSPVTNDPPPKSPISTP